MKIVLCGGKNKAEFLIDSLKKKNHRLIIINDDLSYCDYLSEKFQLPIVVGDPCKQYILEDAQIYDAELLIALKPLDADNLAIAQMAQRIFNVKKVVAIVSNPKNVEVFKRLGVNTAISATYMVAKIIEQASTVETLVNTLSIEHDLVVLSEVMIDEVSKVLNKKIMEIQFPENVIISAIVRRGDLVVPNGKTELLYGDKLIILSSPQSQSQVIKTITGEDI